MAAVMRCATPTRDRAGRAKTRGDSRATRRRRGGAGGARRGRGARGDGARGAGRIARSGRSGGVGGTAARGTGRGARRRAASDAASAGSSYWSEETSRETETVVETTTGGVKATMTFAATEEEDEDEGAGAGKRALGLAAFAAVVAAFAYSDVSASFPFLAPAQTLARALVDMVAAGVDYFVDVTLDAYDAAILGCINVFSWFQSFPADAGWSDRERCEGVVGRHGRSEHVRVQGGWLVVRQAVHVNRGGVVDAVSSRRVVDVCRG